MSSHVTTELIPAVSQDEALQQKLHQADSLQDFIEVAEISDYSFTQDELHGVIESGFGRRIFDEDLKVLRQSSRSIGED